MGPARIAGTLQRRGISQVRKGHPQAGGALRQEAVQKGSLTDSVVDSEADSDAGSNSLMHESAFGVFRRP